MALELNPATTSRVELEPYAAKLRRMPGRAFDAEAIRAELAARVWQWHNPYLDGWPEPGLTSNRESRHPAPRNPPPGRQSRHPDTA